MTEVDAQLAAPKFWGEFISESPIVTLTGAVYANQTHGFPSDNQLINEHQGMALEDDLKDGKWPYIGTVHCMRPENALDPQTFALGSLIYIWPGREKKYPEEEIKLAIRYLNLKQDISLKFLERSGVRPMAIVMLDFDCPNTQANLTRITSTLSINYKKADWTIFETEQSFHAVFKEFVNPKNVPWHWGKVIKAFALGEGGIKKQFFEEIGDQLQKYFDDPEKIKTLSNFIIENITHFDDPNPDGKHFIVDLRWIAHSLLELLSYLETRDGSFGFLRISDKNGKGVPPIAVFKNYS